MFTGCTIAAETAVIHLYLDKKHTFVCQNLHPTEDEICFLKKSTQVMWQRTLSNCITHNVYHFPVIPTVSPEKGISVETATRFSVQLLRCELECCIRRYD